MQIFHDLSPIIPTYPTVLTLGAFDGVHLGHEQLIRATVESARNKGYRSALVTFFPHPRVVLGRAEPFYLTSNPERFARMERLGLDCVVVVKFTLEMAQLSAAQFIAKLVGNLGMREMRIGYDFCLGRDRRGDVASLRDLGAEFGYTVHVTEPVRLDELAISSSRIRAALRAGDLRQANACLGRPFRMCGRVFSTWRDPARDKLVAILGLDKEHAIPSPGAYTCHVHMNGIAGFHRGVVETGTSFSFDMDTHALFVHLPDVDREVLGHFMTLDLIGAEPLDFECNIPFAVTNRFSSIGISAAPTAAIIAES